MLAETMDQTTCGPSDTDTQGFESTPECFDTVKRDFAYPPKKRHKARESTTP
jgi:hypothetical protein